MSLRACAPPVSFWSYGGPPETRTPPEQLTGLGKYAIQCSRSCRNFRPSIWDTSIREEVRSLKLYLVLLPAAALLATGCATTYRPTIDPLTVTDSATLKKDLAECREIAQSVAGDASSEAVQSGATGAVRGAAIGAALGAIAGAITGRAGTGAAIGAATGGASGVIGGATAGGTSAQRHFENAYDACMWERGYELLSDNPPETHSPNSE